MRDLKIVSLLYKIPTLRMFIPKCIIPYKMYRYAYLKNIYEYSKHLLCETAQPSSTKSMFSQSKRQHYDLSPYRCIGSVVSHKRWTTMQSVRSPKHNFDLYNGEALWFSYGPFWYTYTTFPPTNNIKYHYYHSGGAQHNVYSERRDLYP